MISIIIPVYNRGYCISCCLESVLKQTFTDWECIIIDDGSTDQTLSVCQSYVHKDSRFQVYTQPNGGVSAARNKGIEQACGDYIAFIDSDDWVEPDFLRLLHEAAAKGRMAVCGMDSQSASGFDKNCVERSALYTKEGDVEDLLAPGLISLFPGPVCKLYDKSIIDKYKIRFPSGISWGEDTIFNSIYLQYIDKIKGVPYYLYHIIKQEKSLTADAIRDAFLTDKNQELWHSISFYLNKCKGIDGEGLHYHYICLLFDQITGIQYIHKQMSWIKQYKRMNYLIQSADRDVIRRYRFKNIRYFLVYYKISAAIFICYKVYYSLMEYAKKSRNH